MKIDGTDLELYNWPAEQLRQIIDEAQEELAKRQHDGHHWLDNPKKKTPEEKAADEAANKVKLVEFKKYLHELQGSLDDEPSRRQFVDRLLVSIEKELTKPC